MIHKVIRPSAHLQQFVKDYLLLHYVFDGNSPVPVKPFPANTRHCLVFYLRGGITAVGTKTGQSETYPTTCINASQVSPFDFHPSANFLMLEINFQPNALTKFLGLPVAAFINNRIDATSVLGPDISQVREQMVNASSYNEILEIAENYLWGRIQRLKTDFYPIDHVIDLISKHGTRLDTAKMASLACLSISQFERRFVQQMGITPKFYARINRFDKAYQIKDKNPGADWLGIALETGYHDYQHLVKDFREFSGNSPNSLLEAQAGAPERILRIG
jgi:AraC-like DNA-binding protein